jgi:hypothetical protein
MLWLHHTNRSPFIYPLDHVHEEPESENQAEEAPAEATSLELA